ncbi:hypothetical protein DY000_02054291 [Brassica cretica]|uniref:Uncharacterized protein n=1 Tax=Brassica cretica TaxID=69181 RepID=A0ABQ7AJR0_BRACR|nr:hypothetical protein DY000_02054291 [Brassica cretica]
MSDTHNHGEEISADTYATLMRHQFNLESLGDRLQKIENTTATMKKKLRRGDEAMRDFNGRLVPKVTSEMSDTHNHGEEISADTYATLMRHQFNLDSLGDRLQKIENTTATMKEK